MAGLLTALTGTMVVWVPALAGYVCVCAFGYLTRGEDLVELCATRQTSVERSLRGELTNPQNEKKPPPGSAQRSRGGA
jgi:hypothetical protein